MHLSNTIFLASSIGNVYFIEIAGKGEDWESNAMHRHKFGRTYVLLFNADRCGPPPSCTESLLKKASTQRRVPLTFASAPEHRRQALAATLPSPFLPKLPFFPCLHSRMVGVRSFMPGQFEAEHPPWECPLDAKQNNPVTCTVCTKYPQTGYIDPFGTLRGPLCDPFTGCFH